MQICHKRHKKGHNLHQCRKLILFNKVPKRCLHNFKFGKPLSELKDTLAPGDRKPIYITRKKNYPGIPPNPKTPTNKITFHIRAPITPLIFTQFFSSHNTHHKE